MKAILFVLIIATVCTGHPVNRTHIVLKELKSHVKILLDDLSKEHLETYVTNLRNESNDCKPLYFCHAEKVLSGQEELSNLPRVQNVVSALKEYNREHVKTCKVKNTGEEVFLKIFMESMVKCIQKTYRTSHTTSKQ